MRSKDWDFELKQFGLVQRHTSLKVGTDAIALGAWVSQRVILPPRDSCILDVGTGTGILALMMAQTYTQSRVDAIELDPGASLDARYNFENSIYKQRLNLICGDAMSYDYQQTYDLIISNPPYHSESVRSLDRARDISRYDDTEGLGVLKLLDLAEIALRKDTGRLCFIAPYNRLDEIRTLLAQRLWIIRNLCILESSPDEPVRVMLSISKMVPLEYTPTTYETISIRNHTKAEYSTKYKALARDFLKVV